MNVVEVRNSSGLSGTQSCRNYDFMTERWMEFFFLTFFSLERNSHQGHSWIL